MGQDEEGGRVTLATVADQAGVSVSTVSKVLNGREDVARNTRLRVERLLEHHGYHIVAAFSDESDDEDIRMRIEEFMRYLEV